MPILGREDDIYPTTLLDGNHAAGAADGDSHHWWAFYTLSRREKDFMRRLRGLDIPHYGPLIARRQRSPAGRFRTSYVPLFSGYVFVFGTEEQRHTAMTTNCVSRWLPVPDGAQLTRDLRQIRSLVDSGAPLTPEARVEPGQLVRIRSGTFRDLEGVVVKRHGQDRLVIAVRFLQQGASVLLEDCQVEPLA